MALQSNGTLVMTYPDGSWYRNNSDWGMYVMPNGTRVVDYSNGTMARREGDTVTVEKDMKIISVYKVQ